MVWESGHQGHAAAQYNLGLLYENGRGVLQDYVHAHLLFSLAAAGSMPAANTEREFISKKMTRAQISEALRLAREWQPKGNASPLPISPSAPAAAPSSTEDRN